MNKFGSADMPKLVDQLLQASEDINIMIDHTGADRLSALLKDAAETLRAADRYWMAVEAALV